MTVSNQPPYPGIIDPVTPLADGAIIKDVTNGHSAGNIYALMTNGLVNNGDTITIAALPAGGTPFIWGTASRYSYGGLTFQFLASGGVGSALGCFVDEGAAILTSDNGGPNTTYIGTGATTAALGGTEIAWAYDAQTASYRCIHAGKDSGLTVSDMYLHDCDILLDNNETPTGTMTLSNLVLEHGGGGGPGAGSVTHNVYLGCNPGCGATDISRVVVTNVRSYCTHGTSGGGPGFQFKTRWPAGTFTNFIAAEPSQHGYSDCHESAAMDMPCGGAYTLGGAGAGQGAVFELGPGSDQGPGIASGNGDGVIRWNRESGTVPGNCPANGWSGSVLLVQNCWVINDSPFTITAIHTPTGGDAYSKTVKNCKLVNISGLGEGVIDGGGNTFFANRAAAGLGPYPMLPSPP